MLQQGLCVLEWWMFLDPQGDPSCSLPVERVSARQQRQCPRQGLFDRPDLDEQVLTCLAALDAAGALARRFASYPVGIAGGKTRDGRSLDVALGRDQFGQAQDVLGNKLIRT